MKIFIDTANVDHIREMADIGILSGVTTNPTLIAKEGRDFLEVIKEITEIVDGPISGEVISLEAEGMVKEGIEISKIHPNMVVKIPLTSEGLKATKELSKLGIKTNVTLVFSANQALLAATAGATYVSPFVGRLEDTLHDGIEVVADIRRIFDQYNFKTEIISASIRTPKQMADSALVGAHIATVPYEVLRKAITHPLTDKGIKAFMDDWNAVFNKK
ncbi:fructose-6-phosphate aldolase [Candidatus Xianfuyuplasma coldseepsis]|uniref:Probable transaldolase n=1 Tax=Candidatus Xianfuyuplasma coldseepsis TaxID=2782163 RepID=A0A7L7KTE9_9MOLU|nr:fructose-6-phosphate aldolase [Xianfuyuplasma coldseepsis]QMS85516.1 fructose-6-phosphate aldolase [Xianfuyuplasma coldseepsis]